MQNLLWLDFERTKPKKVILLMVPSISCCGLLVSLRSACVGMSFVNVPPPFHELVNFLLTGQKWLFLMCLMIHVRNVE